MSVQPNGGEKRGESSSAVKAKREHHHHHNASTVSASNIGIKARGIALPMRESPPPFR